MKILIKIKYFLKYACLKYISVYALIGLFLLNSCGAKEKYKELQSSINEVEKNADQLSYEDWKILDDEIGRTKKKLKTDRDNYTPEETQIMNKLIGKYYALKAANKVSNLKNEIKDISQQLSGVFETIVKDSTDSKKQSK